MKTAIIFLADGMEECEALIVVDLLRRAGINVVTASVSGNIEVLSSHNVSVKADVLAEDADYDAADIVILPGGMPGTIHLGESDTVRKQCLAFAENKYVAAICAAPSVLAKLGLLEGKEATSYPSFEDKLAGAIVSGKPVSKAGNIITGQALGAAIPFALEIIKALDCEKTAEQTAASICYSWR